MPRVSSHHKHKLHGRKVFHEGGNIWDTLGGGRYTAAAATMQRRQPLYTTKATDKRTDKRTDGQHHRFAAGA